MAEKARGDEGTRTQDVGARGRYKNKKTPRGGRGEDSATGLEEGLDEEGDGGE